MPSWACACWQPPLITYHPSTTGSAFTIATLRTQIKYAIDPPQEAVFVPQGGDPTALAAVVQSTLTAAAPTLPAPTATQQASPTPGPTATLEPTFTPAPTPTAIPARAELKGVVHEYQQMNNCGPTTLAMALTFWDWKGDQRDTRAYLRPNFKDYDDKNVNPSEMKAFVEEKTGLKALVRVGGTVELTKRLVVAGFPVIVEKGFQPPNEDWMGHYALITGYDDNREKFTTLKISTLWLTCLCRMPT